MISSDDAALLIDKYRREQTRLRIFFIARDKSLNVRLTGTLHPGVDLSGELFFLSPSGDFVTAVVLRDCGFEYGDAREVVDAETRERSEMLFASCLTIIFPSGERLYVAELR